MADRSLRRAAGALAVAALACATAHAQPGPPPPGLSQPPPGVSAPPPPATILHLSATGSVAVAPDLLVADLVAQSSSPSAAAAQRRVNAMMAAATKAASGVAGVDARATGYAVSPNDDKRTTWTAAQTLELRGADGPSLLDLTGRLQQAGLAVASLDWQLSPSLRARAHDQAEEAALKALLVRARAAAAALGLRVASLRDVRLDDPDLSPRMAFRAMRMEAGAMAPPQASAAPEDVTAQAEAEIALEPAR